MKAWIIAGVILTLSTGLIYQSGISPIYAFLLNFLLGVSLGWAAAAHNSASQAYKIAREARDAEAVSTEFVKYATGVLNGYSEVIKTMTPGNEVFLQEPELRKN